MLVRKVVCLIAACALVGPASAAAAGRCGQHPWCDTGLSPDRRADLLVGALTQEEKLGLLAGDEPTVPIRAANNYATDRYAHALGVPRLDVPPLYIADGPVGVNRDKATLLPSPALLAATWDPASATAYGAVLGDEVKRTGHDISLAPAIDVVRTPLAGRAFETYGEDPLLISRTAVPYIRALQAQGVMANAKHFVYNNQEGRGGDPRLPLTGVEGGRFTVNVNADDRTLHELYLPMYEAAIKEGDVASVMCAYNRLGSEKACESQNLATGILRGELGFEGFLLTDFNAALQNTIAGLKAGTELELAWTQAYRPQLVQAAVTSGAVPQAKVDAAVHRQLRTFFKFGFFDRASYANDRSTIDVAGHARISGEIARNGTVLLRNARGTLPLDTRATPRIAVIGRAAVEQAKGAGSGEVDPFTYVTPLEGIRRRAGDGTQVIYDDGSDPARAAAVARAADVAIVLTYQPSQEGSDLACIRLDCEGRQDGLIDAVAAAQPRNVVVLQTGSAVETPWRAQTGAILEAWYGGSDAGTALAAVLFGDDDPGGRLPVTFPKRLADTPTAGSQRRYPGVAEEVYYDEGLYVGYRHYDANAVEPAFAFGHGLSYADFSMTKPRAGARLSDGSSHAAVTVRNTSARPGIEVAQVYLEKPNTDALPQAPRSLAAYAKVRLSPGEAKRVLVDLPTRAFQSWDTASKSWKTVAGCHRVHIGRSSRDTQFAGSVGQVGATGCPQPPRPAARRCTSRRVIDITAPRSFRRSARSVAVSINGRRVRTVRGAAARRAVRVDLRGRARGRVRVALRLRQRDGRTREVVRTYRLCVARGG